MDKRGVFSSTENLRITSLFEFTQLVISLYPDYLTTNPHNSMKEKIDLSGYFYRHHREDVYRLYHLLVHSFTCLNHLYRLQDKQGNYISDKEDNVKALNMLQQEGFTDMLLSEVLRKTYRDLMSYYGVETQFTAKKCCFILQMSKTTMNRHLLELERLGYVYRTGGDKKTGYQYKLLDKLHPDQLSDTLREGQRKEEESLFNQGLPEVKTSWPL